MLDKIGTGRSAGETGFEGHGCQLARCPTWRRRILRTLVQQLSERVPLDPFVGVRVRSASRVDCIATKLNVA